MQPTVPVQPTAQPTQALDSADRGRAANQRTRADPGSHCDESDQRHLQASRVAVPTTIPTQVPTLVPTQAPIATLIADTKDGSVPQVRGDVVATESRCNRISGGVDGHWTQLCRAGILPRLRANRASGSAEQHGRTLGGGGRCVSMALHR